MTIKETVRRDGLRMISCNIPTQTKVMVGVSALVGSAYDPADRQGLFHYFEHMAFKGTAHRNVKQIQDFINRHLLDVNAATYRTRTEYWGVAVYTKLALACDLVTDLYAHSTFPASEIQKEKGPVLLEAARNRDDDGYLADLTLRQSLYAKNPLRQAGVGTEDGIAGITRRDLVREKAKWYVPANTVAVAVGRVSHAAFVNEVEKRIPFGAANVPAPAWDPEFASPPSASRETIERNDRQKTTVIMGCKMPDRLSDRAEAAEDFVCSLLVSGWSSRLWNEVREKRGLAYSANGGVSRSIGLGAYFDAFVQTKPGKEAIVEKLMRQALFSPITAKDKEIFEATRESAQDAITAGFGENLGAWNGLIYDKVSKGESVASIKRYFAEQRAIVNKLTLREAEKIRRELFRPERFATVIVKPVAR
jgi:predicted Zn-dependent peptidase